MPLRGALFDWDGVVVNSSAAHERSWELIAHELGLPLPEGHFKKGFGMKNERVIPDVLGWTQDAVTIAKWSLRKEEIYREVIERDGLVPLPGLEKFLQALQLAGIPCCIGSSTHRANIDQGLSKIGLASYFPSVVTAEDVSHGKPDPEIFLKAAARTGARPDECVVFEDAHVGVEAGVRGGMKVVALTTTHPRETLEDAHLIVSGWETLTLDQVQSLFDK